VRGYEPWGWVVVSGIYIDDIDETFYTKLAEQSVYIGVSAIVLILLSLVIVGSINQPLHKLHLIMADIQNSGNLALRGDVNQRDETGLMARSFNNMLSSLQQVMNEVKGMASRVDESSIFLSAITEQTREGMYQQKQQTEQAAQAAQAGSSLESIAGAVSQITDMSIQVASSLEEQSAVAEEINRNVISIRDVADQTSDASTHMKDTGDDFNQLSNELLVLLERYKV